jgi:uncharacterized membrane protein
MSESARFALATLCGLVIAGMVHLSAVLAMPWLSEHDAFSRLADTLAADRAQIVAAPATGETWLPQPDPNLAISACAYNLADGPVRIATRTGRLFQSLSFHARGAGVFYAVTDRAAIRGSLDLVVMTRRQLDEILAREDEEDPSRDVRIVAPSSEGFAVVRVLATTPSQRQEAEDVARSVACTIDPLPGAPRR